MVLGISVAAPAGSGASWLDDEKYSGDGKAEFNVYDAREVRYGRARPSEVIHISVREPFSNRELVKAEPGSKSGTFHIVKLNQLLASRPE
ncbi:MAG: hypothetical protein JWQ44_814 [Chthoniobacter sp.]|nr:hypothetical protein [Chthoniobacter sp.]